MLKTSLDSSLSSSPDSSLNLTRYNLSYFNSSSVLYSLSQRSPHLAALASSLSTSNTESIPVNTHLVAFSKPSQQIWFDGDNRELLTHHKRFNSAHLTQPTRSSTPRTAATVALKTDALTGLSATQSLTTNPHTDRLLNFNTGQTVVRHIQGTLRADRFTYSPRYRYTLFSGKGNIDFGAGYRDFIDLSTIHSNMVRFNLANQQGGGVVLNPGNGARVFDVLTLRDGRQILFEGIDSIRFSNGTVNLSVTPNDPLFAQQSSLHSMGIQNAWRFTTGSNRVLVGVQDTGLGVKNGLIHDDLRSTTIYNNNYHDDSIGSASHGTAVQGIIAARSNNSTGISGINWNSNVFHIDVLGSNAGDQTTDGATQNMIAHATRNGQRLVINMSLGTSSFNQNFHTNLARVVANNPNVLFVISAGNDGHLGRSGLASPAMLAQQYENVIAVGASWGTQDRNGFAKTPGQRIHYDWWGSQYGPGLTLMAPSEVISTRSTRDSFGQVKFDYYLTGDRFNGTSAAAPNVAGVASLAWSVNPQLSAGQIKGILSRTAYDLGTPGYDYLHGHGFVDADAAVRQAMAYARA